MGDVARLGWDKLTIVQQWRCEQALGIESATEVGKPRTSQVDKWAANLAAAQQFFERAGTFGYRASMSRRSLSGR